MEPTRDNLLPIGSFARATQLSLKALRLYAQLGLLTPHYTDPESSYRYYHADQFHTARLIRLMREIDMPLATIRQVLAAAPTQAESLVREYGYELEARAALARRLAPSLIATVRKEARTMTLDVTMREAAAQPILSITSHVKVDQLSQTIGTSLQTLYAFAQQHGFTATEAPFGIYHGPINHQENGPIEVCVPIDQAGVGTDTVAARELPGGRLATVTLIGDQCAFPAILQGYDAVHDWISSNGYAMTDAPREIWHSSPGENARMEIAWPFT